MDYIDYYYKNRIDDELDITNFSSGYFGKFDVSSISEKVADYFEPVKPKPDYPIIEYRNWKNLYNEIQELSNILIPQAEANYYGCNLRCDKIYIYRNVPCNKKQSSWIWHYDNNPPTVLKLMVYLTDVDETTAPLQVVNGQTFEPTRLGPSQWKSAPNNSRVPESEIDEEKIKSYYGGAGTTMLFYPNTTHRATSPDPGKHRDILVIRVKPTDKDHSNDYIKYATSFECSGVCSKEPG